MKLVETCKRCGWQCFEHEPTNKISGWPSTMPLPPPLPEASQPHPPGTCCSPFVIGDKLYWNLDGIDSDLPPLKVVFVSLAEIEPPAFQLVQGVWKQVAPERAVVASVTVVTEEIYPQHEELFGRDELVGRTLELMVRSLTPEHLWPAIEVDD